MAPASFRLRPPGYGVTSRLGKPAFVFAWLAPLGEGGRHVAATAALSLAEIN
jgi:hypothetical protein